METRMTAKEFHKDWRFNPKNTGKKLSDLMQAYSDYVNKEKEEYISWLIKKKDELQWKLQEQSNESRRIYPSND